MTAPDVDVAAAHRHFSADCFNRVWELLDKPDRTPGDNQLMVSTCHASLYYWQQRPDCTPRNLSIGYWQLSRVYAVLGQADNARDYARHCRIHSANEEPFFLGYACEAAARAEFLAGKFDDGERFLAEAHGLADQVADPDDRKLLEQDLEELTSLIKLRDDPGASN